MQGVSILLLKFLGTTKRQTGAIVIGNLDLQRALRNRVLEAQPEVVYQRVGNPLIWNAVTEPKQGARKIRMRRVLFLLPKL